MSAGEIFNDPAARHLIQNVDAGRGWRHACDHDAGRHDPPSRPGRALRARSGTDVALQWTPAGDDYAIASYAVARDGAPLGSTAATSFGDSGLMPGATVTTR